MLRNPSSRAAYFAAIMAALLAARLVKGDGDAE